LKPIGTQREAHLERQNAKLKKLVGELLLGFTSKDEPLE
jgi:hypothetical protein